MIKTLMLSFAAALLATGMASAQTIGLGLGAAGGTSNSESNTAAVGGGGVSGGSILLGLTTTTATQSSSALSGNLSGSSAQVDGNDFTSATNSLSESLQSSESTIASGSLGFATSEGAALGGSGGAASGGATAGGGVLSAFGFLQ